VNHRIVAALIALATTPALAQAPTPTGDASSEATSSETTPAEPSLEERLATAEGKLASFEEKDVETQSTLSALKKLKLSGYVQGRYTYIEPDEVEIGGATVRRAPGSSLFSVRRGRLKATYAGDVGQLVLQLDATPSGVSLKDAEATLFIPGTKQKHALTIGQTKWSFGYEVNQSSSEREFPERTLVVRRFAAGERDRGIKYTGKAGPLRLAAGVYDGIGTDGVSRDNDKMKDAVARVGFDLKWISGGVSGWYGSTLRAGETVDGTYRPAEAFDRNRIGADVQVYLDVLPLGGTALKGEYIAGTTYFTGGGKEAYGQSAAGWYALLVQSIGESNALALRYEFFDPATGTPNRDSGTAPALRAASTNQVGTLGATLIHYFGDSLKASATYELPTTRTVDAEEPNDNVLTLQLQAKF
jgi:hypothetical protein